jgi:deoxyadenosine/deoxycytidine kinase
MKKKRLEYLKKLTGSVQFWFHKLETEKSNRIEINNRAKQKKKQSQTVTKLITKKPQKQHIFLFLI